MLFWLPSVGWSLHVNDVCAFVFMSMCACVCVFVCVYDYVCMHVKDFVYVCVCLWVFEKEKMTEQDRETDRDREFPFPSLAAIDWVFGAEKQDITQQPISVWIMSYLSLTPAFPSTTLLLWVPFTQVDRSSRWKETQHSYQDIELPGESLQIIFRGCQLYRGPPKLDDFKDFLKVWGKLNFHAVLTAPVNIAL